MAKLVWITASMLVLLGCASAQSPDYETLSFAFPIEDLDTDSGIDFLVNTIGYSEYDDTYISEVSVLKGSDGMVIWDMQFCDALAFAYSIDDLNGDDVEDVVINVLAQGLSTLDNAIPNINCKITAVSGYDGTEIWSKSELMAAAFAYPHEDITGDNVTELVIHVFNLDILGDTINTKIQIVDGHDGSVLDTKKFFNSIAAEYPSRDLTGDGHEDNILGIYRIEEDDENEIPISSEITAIDGMELSDLWSMSFDSSLAIAVPTGDLTGDNMSDIMIYHINETEEGEDMIEEIIVVKGDDGTVVWSMSFDEGTLAIATQDGDLTGDNISDIMIYKMEDIEDDINDMSTSELIAVKGDDGTILWQKPSLFVMPSLDDLMKTANTLGCM
ncbi:MAG: hypothetical protein ACXQT2_03810 [Methanotrichaceae archaeon]